MKKTSTSAKWLRLVWVLLGVGWSALITAQAQPTSCSGTDPGGQPAANGLYAEYFSGYFADDAGFFTDNAHPAGLVRTEAQVNFATNASFGDLRPLAEGSAQDPDRFSLRLRGSLLITTPGEYTFYLTSDDAAYLWLDNAALALPPDLATALIDNGGGHSSLTRTATVTLAAGRHNVLILYGDDCCDHALVWEYEGPGVARQVVPTAALCTAAAPAPLAPQAIRYAPATRALPAGTARSSGLPTVQDGGSAVTEFAVANAGTLPAGITMNATTGVLTAAASVAQGTYDVHVAVSNANGTSIFRNAFRFLVTAPLPGGCGGPDPGGEPASGGLYAEYFSGYFADDPAFFSGRTPGLVRTDTQVNFPDDDSFGNLLAVATGSVQNPDAFSLRLRGSLYLAATGSYTFYLTSDDAAYLWLDNAALAAPTVLADATLNNGGSHPAATVAVTLTLGAGLHNLQLLYGDNGLHNSLVLEYESAGLGIARQVVPTTLFCTSVQPQVPPPVALDYSPQHLRVVVGSTATSAAPAVVSSSAVIEYVLDNAASLPAGITINATTGQVTASATVPEADYQLDVAARNAGGAAVFTRSLAVQVIPPAPAGCAGFDANGQMASSGLYAEFFPGYFNDDPAFFSATTPAQRRNVSVIDFNSAESWGNLTGAASGSSIDPDSFSVRLRGRIRIPTAGTYTFYLTADDGAFQWLDNAALQPTPVVAQALIQNDGIHPETTIEATVSLTAGLHDVLVLYGENSAFTRLKLEYASTDAGVPRQLTPAADLCTSNSNAPLPVTLVHFKVQPQDADVALSWETAQELNSRVFVVERSGNGQVFEEIGQLAAAGTTARAQRYTFLDRAPLTGTNYYRLRQLDLDGTAHLSGVVAVHWGGAVVVQQLRLFPNPSPNGEVTVELAQPTAETATVEVLDMRGALVHRQVVPAATHPQQVPLKLRKLPAGIYLLRLVTPTGVTTSRLVLE
jgi:hypothetical protein